MTDIIGKKPGPTEIEAVDERKACLLLTFGGHSWRLTRKFKSTDNEGHHFSYALALSDRWIAVGDDLENNDGEVAEWGCGAVYLYPVAP